MFDLLSGGLGASHPRSGRNDRRMRIDALEIERQRSLWTVEPRVAAAARCPDTDRGKVSLVTCSKCSGKAQHGRRIRNPESIVKQALAIHSAEICVSGYIAVTGLRTYVYAACNSSVPAVSKTFVRSAGGLGSLRS